MFTITSEPVLSQVERYGNASIKYKVEGFWSNDLITVYISRRFGSDKWHIYDSHASGGTDDKFEGSEWERTRNFGSAMLDAADKIHFWSNNIQLLEEAAAKYDAEMAIRAEQRAREQEAIRLELEEAERIDRIINPSMGTEAATKLAAELKAQVTITDSAFAWQQVRPRANDANYGRKVMAEAQNLTGKSTRFYLNKVAMSKAHFIKTLAEDFVIAQEVAA